MSAVPDQRHSAREKAERRWGLQPGAIDGLDGILQRMRETYMRVEALATQIVPAEPDPASRQVRRIAGTDELGAWMHRIVPQTSDAIGGPLEGRRLVVKDSMAVAGVPMTAGSAFLDPFVPRQSAVVVQRAVRAGAELVGTAVCEDLCFSGSSFTSVTGPVRNPYDLQRAAGGSTSGCAALIASRQADLGLGTDLGGSVRNPASWCGIAAIKPTYGIVPYTGAMATELSMDHIGLMARRVDALAMFLDAVAGADPGDPRQAGAGNLAHCAEGIDADVASLRVGVVAEGFGWPERSHPEHDRIVRGAAAQLAGICGGAESVSIPLHVHARDIHVPIACEGGLATVFEQNSQGSNHIGVNDPDLAVAFGQALEVQPDLLPLNGKIAAIAGTVLRQETRGRVLALAQALRLTLREQYDEALRRFDILVMPTVPMPPHRLPTSPPTPRDHQALAFEMHDNNCAFNLTGHPALSVPCGMLDGLPVGMLMIGRHRQDHLVLRLAHHFQQKVFIPPAPPNTGEPKRNREQGVFK